MVNSSAFLASKECRERMDQEGESVEKEAGSGRKKK
jgi:hypothetical protein